MGRGCKMSNGNRAAFKMQLKKGNEMEYKNRHDEIWPELLVLLKEQGISDYAIFLDEESGTLFGVQKIAGDSGSQDLGKNPVFLDSPEDVQSFSYQPTTEIDWILSSGILFFPV